MSRYGLERWLQHGAQQASASRSTVQPWQEWLANIPGGGGGQTDPFAPEPGSDEDILQRAQSRHESRGDIAAASGATDPSGEAPSGVLNAAVGILNAPISAVSGVASGLIGADTPAHEASGNPIADAVYRGVTGFFDTDTHYLPSDADWFQPDDDRGTAENVARRATGFLVDVAADPLTYITLGGSVVGKKIATEAVAHTARSQASRELGEAGLARWAQRAPRVAAPKHSLSTATTQQQREAAEAAVERGLTPPQTWGGTRDEWLANVGEQQFGAAAAESFQRGGSIGLRRFFKTELGDEAGERMFQSLPRDVKGGMRVRRPFHRREHDRLAETAGAGGGGDFLERIGLGRAAEKAHEIRNRVRSSGIGRVVADNLGGKDGDLYGDMVAGLVRRNLDEPFQSTPYAVYQASRQARRDARIAGRMVHDTTVDAIGHMRNQIDMAPDRQAAEATFDEWVFDAERVDRLLGTDRPSALGQIGEQPTLDAMDESTRRGVTAALMFHDYLKQSRAQMLRQGLSVDEINDYIPRIMTEEERLARAAAKPARPSQRAGGGGVSGYDQRKTRRQYVEVEWVDSETGPALRRVDLTPEEANAASGRAVFETDPAVVMARYGDAARRLITRTAFANSLDLQGAVARGATRYDRILGSRHVADAAETLVEGLDSHHRVLEDAHRRAVADLEDAEEALRRSQDTHLRAQRESDHLDEWAEEVVPWMEPLSDPAPGRGRERLWAVDRPDGEVRWFADEQAARAARGDDGRVSFVDMPKAQRAGLGDDLTPPADVAARRVPAADEALPADSPLRQGRRAFAEGEADRAARQAEAELQVRIAEERLAEVRRMRDQAAGVEQDFDVAVEAMVYSESTPLLRAIMLARPDGQSPLPQGHPLRDEWHGGHGVIDNLSPRAVGFDDRADELAPLLRAAGWRERNMPIDEAPEAIQDIAARQAQTPVESLATAGARWIAWEPPNRETLEAAQRRMWQTVRQLGDDLDDAEYAARIAPWMERLHQHHNRRNEAIRLREQLVAAVRERTDRSRRIASLDARARNARKAGDAEEAERLGLEAVRLRSANEPAQERVAELRARLRDVDQVSSEDVWGASLTGDLLEGDDPLANMAALFRFAEEARESGYYLTYRSGWQRARARSRKRDAYAEATKQPEREGGWYLIGDRSGGQVEQTTREMARVRMLQDWGFDDVVPMVPVEKLSPAQWRVFRALDYSDLDAGLSAPPLAARMDRKGARRTDAGTLIEEDTDQIGRLFGSPEALREAARRLRAVDDWNEYAGRLPSVDGKQVTGHEKRAAKAAADKLDAAAQRAEVRRATAPAPSRSIAPDAAAPRYGPRVAEMDPTIETVGWRELPRGDRRAAETAAGREARRRWNEAFRAARVQGRELPDEVRLSPWQETPPGRQPRVVQAAEADRKRTVRPERTAARRDKREALRREERARRDVEGGVELIDSMELYLQQLRDEMDMLARDRDMLQTRIAEIMGQEDVDMAFDQLGDLVDGLLDFHDRAHAIAGREMEGVVGAARGRLKAERREIRERLRATRRDIGDAKRGREQVDEAARSWEEAGLRKIGEMRPDRVNVVMPPELDLAYAPDSMRVAVERYYRAMRPEGDTGLGRFVDGVYKPYFQLFKLYATVARGPGYHARNTVGGLWNNWLRDVTVGDHNLSARLVKGRRDAWAEAIDTVAKRMAREGNLTEAEAVSQVPMIEATAEADRILQRTLGSVQVSNDYTLYDIHWLSMGEEIGWKDSRIFEGVHDLLRRQRGDADAARFWQADPRRPMTEAQGPVQMWRDTDPEELSRLQRALNKTADWWWIDVSKEWAGVSEDFIRHAAFIRGVREFGADDGGQTAALLSRALHFDYQDLSDFERVWMRGTLIPFYVWTRNNVPLQMRAMVKEPGKMHRLHLANDALEDVWGDDEYDVVPEWMQEKMGWVSRARFGGSPIVIGVESPAYDLNRFLKVGPPGEVGRSMSRNLIGNVSPVFKLPVELMLGYDSFTGSPFNPRGQEAPLWWRAIPGAPTRTDDQGVVRAPSAGLKVFRDSIPPLGQVERLLPMTEQYRERWPTSWAATLTAAPVSTLSPRQEAGELRARADRLQRRIDWQVQVDEQDAIEELLEAGFPPEAIRRMLQDAN